MNENPAVPPPSPTPSPTPDDEAGPIGPFPTWRAVYTSVLIYWLALVVVLWVLTDILDAPGR